MEKSLDISRPENRKCQISVLIPCFNEENDIVETITAVHAVLEKSGFSHEIIVIDDGSLDRTPAILEKIIGDFSSLKMATHFRNYGQTAAYQTGFEMACGENILLYSGDIEIPAEQILEVIRLLNEGFDFVNTSRKNRWRGAHALKSRLANSLLNKLNRLNFEDRGSGLKGINSAIGKQLCLYGEWHRFLPDLASIHTDRIVEFQVPFEERKKGTSSYTGRMKSMSVLLDLATVVFTVHSNRKPFHMLPGRLFGFFGLILASAGGSCSLWLIGTKIFLGAALASRPLFLIGLLTFILGVVMIMVGVLGELVMQLSARLTPRNRIRRIL